MATTRPLYIVVDWNDTFETAESRRNGRNSWVAMPNKHDGKSFRRIMREKDGSALYGAWCLIVQVASKMPVRGTLSDSDGPLDATDLEDKTGCPAKLIERTLKLMMEERIGWMAKVENPDEIAGLFAPTHESVGTPGARSGRAQQSVGKPASAQSVPRAADDLPRAPGADADLPRAPRAHSGHTQQNVGVPTPRGRALAKQYSTGQDSTGQHTQSGATAQPGVREASPLEETASFVLELFGKKRTRLSQEAEFALGRQADSLPLKDGQKAMLAWFMGLPPDPQDIPLRSRPSDADRLAINLFATLERAEAYSEKNSAGPGTEKSGPSEPPEWREWFASRWPEKKAPPLFSELPDYVQREAREAAEGVSA